MYCLPWIIMYCICSCIKNSKKKCDLNLNRKKHFSSAPVSQIVKGVRQVFENSSGRGRGWGLSNRIVFLSIGQLLFYEVSVEIIFSAPRQRKRFENCQRHVGWRGGVASKKRPLPADNTQNF